MARATNPRPVAADAPCPPPLPRTPNPSLNPCVGARPTRLACGPAGPSKPRASWPVAPTPRPPTGAGASSTSGSTSTTRTWWPWWRSRTCPGTPCQPPGWCGPASASASRWASTSTPSSRRATTCPPVWCSASAPPRRGAWSRSRRSWRTRASPWPGRTRPSPSAASEARHLGQHPKPPPPRRWPTRRPWLRCPTPPPSTAPWPLAPKHRRRRAPRPPAPPPATSMGPVGRQPASATPPGFSLRRSKPAPQDVRRPLPILGGPLCCPMGRLWRRRRRSRRHHAGPQLIR